MELLIEVYIQAKEAWKHDLSSQMKLVLYLDAAEKLSDYIVQHKELAIEFIK